MFRRWYLAGLALVLLLAARTTYLVVDYLLGGATRRYHVETSATLFVIAGLAFHLVRARRQAAVVQVHEPPFVPAVEDARRPHSLSSIRSRGVWPWLPFSVAAAFALYWPALTIGWLSDDFVLIARAANWDIAAVTPALMRPVPLAAWSVLVALAAPDAAWHVLNVVLHGVNAWLTARLVAAWLPWPWPLAAGAVMLTAPLAPEAVAWASGIFDVSATTMTLTAVMAGRAYARTPGALRRAALFGAVLLAIGCKETAVVAPVLVLIDAWIRRAVTRTLLIDLGALTGLAAAFALVRLLSAFGMTAPPVSKYLVQRIVFESYGSLSVPWHELTRASGPAFAALAAVVLIVLATAFFLHRATDRTNAVPGGAAWVLVAVLPVAPILFVAPDLQGSRYLYLATPAWAGLVTAFAAGGFAARRPLAAGALLVLVVIAAWGVRQHLAPWQAAAAARDAVLAAALAPDVARCRTVRLSGLPDNIRGAYVFRNGAPEAFARQGLRVSPDASPDCAFTWDATALRFVRQ